MSNASGHPRFNGCRCPTQYSRIFPDNFLLLSSWSFSADTSDLALDTGDLMVAGVPISISGKYLYLYLKLSGSTNVSLVITELIVNNSFTVIIQFTVNGDNCTAHNNRTCYWHDQFVKLNMNRQARCKWVNYSIVYIVHISN